MKKLDIASRQDIKLIIITFYDKLLSDKRIAYFFKKFIQKNTLEPHLESITNFWEDILFHTNNYKNNPMQKHLNHHKNTPFSKEHFTIWLNYLTTTVDNNFSGKKATLLKQRAQSIALVMQLKMNVYQK